MNGRQLVFVYLDRGPDVLKQEHLLCNRPHEIARCDLEPRHASQEHGVLLVKWVPVMSKSTEGCNPCYCVLMKPVTMKQRGGQNPCADINAMLKVAPVSLSCLQGAHLKSSDSSRSYWVTRFLISTEDIGSEWRVESDRFEHCTV